MICLAKNRRAKRHGFTGAQDLFIRGNFHKLGTREVAKRLGLKPEQIKSRAYRLGLRSLKPHRIWSSADDKLLSQHYGKIPAAQLAAQIGASLASVYQRANKLGLCLHLFLTDRDRERLHRHILRLHKQGWSDKDMADAWKRRNPSRPISRESVCEHRRLNLGLPNNALSERRRRKQAAITREQLRKAGLPSLGHLRVMAYRRFAREHGWPEDLGPRYVQVLDALFQHGPMTKRQICVATGMPIKSQSRKTLVGNMPGGSILATLMRRQLVVRLGRSVVEGPTRWHSVYVYSLGLNVVPRR